MSRVTLVSNGLEFAEQIFEKVMNPNVRGALGLPEQKLDDTRGFIQSVVQKEAEGTQVSRVVLDEHGELIGLTDLMFIDHEKKECHIGSWLAYEAWGKGYNEEAKKVILSIAFEELGLERVFAGARVVNVRSQKAQEKLPYMSLDVGEQFPEVLAWLEAKEKQPCVLNVVHREDFLSYMKQHA